MATSASDWDSFGRDQDLSIDESYSKTEAKSYGAESYDEWDNQDNDKWGAQAWGKDRDVVGASSYGKAASSGDYDSYGASGHGKDNNAWQGASAQYGAAAGAYDNDEWAKQASGSDYDSRWGKSYDRVDAKSYANEEYAKQVRADDDVWAEDYDRYDSRDKDAYGAAASAGAVKGASGSYGYGGYGANNGYGGYGANAGYGKKDDGASYYGASQAGYGQRMAHSGSDWDSFGRDQDYSEDVSYSKTDAKSYGAESYDEWDNQDNDKWGAQSWGKDRDVVGASSYGKAASSGDYNSGAHGKGYGYNAGYGAKDNAWQGASAQYGAAQSGYDNDVWAKQANGSDFDSRWGKSYDRVDAKSYANEDYSRQVRADDDVWAQDYDRHDSRDAAGYGKAASAAYGKADAGYGSGYGAGYGKGADNYGASQAGYGGYWGHSGSDWDSYGRDQDLSIDESYSKTDAKSYGAESYDEWDNQDNDKWGAQSWGQDRDLYGASSYGKAASAGDYQNAGYGASHGKGYGSGYGHNAGYGAQEKDASAQYGAASGAYDNDVWAKQAAGSDYDSRWGKSYDRVDAKSYANEDYARKVRADDDVWAQDYDRYDSRDKEGYGQAASAAYSKPAEKKAAYGYGYGNGADAGYGYGATDGNNYSYGAASAYKAPAAKASYGGYGNQGYGNNYGW
jgi:hypothetical protein